MRVFEDKIEWYLPTRKNCPWPTTVARGCWCEKCRLTCPVHAIGCAFRKLQPGVLPFAGIDRRTVCDELRALLGVLGVSAAFMYRSQDLRRGHADDQRKGGKTLHEILIAGGWRSAGAHRSYMDLNDLEMEACMEAHCLSHDEEDD